MVTKSATKTTRGAPKPHRKVTELDADQRRQLDRKFAELDTDQRRQLEEAIRERQRNAPAWENKTREELEEEETKELLESLNDKGEAKDKKKRKKSGGCGHKNPCGKEKPQLNVELLAEKIF